MDQSGSFSRDFAAGASGHSALLIDGENVASYHATEVLGWNPMLQAVRNVYGDLAKLNGWTKVPELRVIHAPEGRNSADILLAVDAMTMFASGVRDFVIVTADGGLVHLVRRLREMGCRVVVMADDRATPALRAVGHHFAELVRQNTDGVPPEMAAPAITPPSPSKPSLDVFLRSVIGAAGAKGMPIVDLNPVVLRELGFRVGTTPEGNWRAFLTAPARNGVFVCDRKGPDARVRLALTPTP